MIFPNSFSSRFDLFLGYTEFFRVTRSKMINEVKLNLANINTFLFLEIEEWNWTAGRGSRSLKINYSVVILSPHRRLSLYFDLYLEYFRQK